MLIKIHYFFLLSFLHIICVSKPGVTAHAYGDPHFLTFDTRSYNFQGECEYLLASDCLADSSRFQVVINNDKSANFPDYAQVAGVDVTVDNIVSMFPALY